MVLLPETPRLLLLLLQSQGCSAVLTVLLFLLSCADFLASIVPLLLQGRPRLPLLLLLQP